MNSKTTRFRIHENDQKLFFEKEFSAILQRAIKKYLFKRTLQVLFLRY